MVGRRPALAGGGTIAIAIPMPIPMATPGRAGEFEIDTGFESGLAEGVGGKTTDPADGGIVYVYVYGNDGRTALPHPARTRGGPDQDRTFRRTRLRRPSPAACSGHATLAHAGNTLMAAWFPT